MSVYSKLSVLVLFLLLLLLAQPRLSRTDDIDELIVKDDDYPEKKDTNFTFFIVGGYRPTKPTLTAHLVMLQYTTQTRVYGSNFFCAGSIISPKFILTAAHCLEELEEDELIVTAGTHKRLERTVYTKDYQVEKIIRHPGYLSRHYPFDLALLLLKDPIEMVPQVVQTVPLTNVPPAEGAHCTVVGWGRLFELGPVVNEALHVEINIWPNDKCKKRLRGFGTGMLCAGDSNNFEKDACTGDSGGPFFCNGTLSGVVSFGYGCATPGLAGVYTDVWHYRDWIGTYFTPTLKTSSPMEESFRGSALSTHSIAIWCNFVFSVSCWAVFW